MENNVTVVVAQITDVLIKIYLFNFINMLLIMKFKFIVFVSFLKNVMNLNLNIQRSKLFFNILILQKIQIHILFALISVNFILNKFTFTFLISCYKKIQFKIIFL